MKEVSKIGIKSSINDQENAKQHKRENASEQRCKKHCKKGHKVLGLAHPFSNADKADQEQHKVIDHAQAGDLKETGSFHDKHKNDVNNRTNGGPDHNALPHFG